MQQELKTILIVMFLFNFAISFFKHEMTYVHRCLTIKIMFLWVVKNTHKQILAHRYYLTYLNN